MRCPAVGLLALAIMSTVCARAEAQDDAPPIGPFVVDVRGTFPKFTNEPLLADSRGLSVGELPGLGLGVDVNAHVYLFTWRAMTFGLGGQLTLARAHATPRGAAGQGTGRPVTERLTSLAPQFSFNFGTGDGWSYISGGIGPSIWSVVPDGQDPLPGDTQRLETINYGGGARWFAKPRVAFTFDVRFYAIAPSAPHPPLPSGPRTTMLIMGAGISLK